MKRLLYWSFLFILFCSACVESEKERFMQAEQVWKMNIAEADTLLPHTIDSIHFLPLFINDEGLLYGVDKLVVRNGLFYLGDFRAGKIVAFDSEGNQRFVVDEKGLGPKEYLEIKSFAVDDRFIYVIDNYRHILNAYDCQNGTFVKSMKMPFVAWDMEILPDKNFIFTYILFKEGNGPNMKQPRYKIFVTDSTLHTVRKYLEYEKEDYEFLGKKTYFSPTSEGVLFSSLGIDDLFLFCGQDSVRRIQVDFSHKIPTELRKDWEAINKGGYNFFVNTPLFCKDYVAFAAPEGEFFMYYLYQMKKGELWVNSTTNAYKMLLPPCASYQGSLISYLDDYSSYEELVEYGFERMDAEFEEHLKAEKPILVFYVLTE